MKKMTMTVGIFLLVCVGAYYWMGTDSDVSQPNRASESVANVKPSAATDPVAVVSQPSAGRKPVVSVVRRRHSPVVTKSKAVTTSVVDNPVQYVPSLPTEFQAGLPRVSAGDTFPKLGIRLGGGTSEVALDVYAFPIKALGQQFVTRLSLSVTPEPNGGSAAVLHINELISVAKIADATVYVGAGANLSLATGGKVNLEGMVGIEKPVALFGMDSGAAFVELGVSRYASDQVPGVKTNLDATLGYKASF